MTNGDWVIKRWYDRYGSVVRGKLAGGESALMMRV